MTAFKQIEPKFTPMLATFFIQSFYFDILVGRGKIIGAVDGMHPAGSSPQAFE
jgi:hypothetical protein